MKNILVRQIFMITTGLVLMIYIDGAANAGEKKSQDPDYFVSHELLVKFHLWANETEKHQVRQIVDAVLIKEIKTLRVEY